MKRTMILLIGVLILISCQQQKEQVSKFIFDASKMSNKTIFYYKYDSEKLVSQTDKNYIIMFGHVVDSTTTLSEFEYNDKELLTKEISQSDFEEKPTFKIYNYNQNDSLISKLSLNSENDTTFWEVYEYYPDGKKTIFHRDLSMHFDPNQDIAKSMEDTKLDTFFFRNEFEYADGLCKTQRQFDKYGNLIQAINFEYIGDQILKETHLTYFNDLEMIEKVKTYDYSKSVKNPDSYSLNSQNDTIEFCINEFSNGFLSTTFASHANGQNINKTFYKNGKEVGLIGIDFNMNFKIVDSYEYYESGELKEIQSYSEEINNAH